MLPREQLEDDIRSSYTLIREFEENLRHTSDPQEQGKLRSGIAYQWKLIAEMLEKYDKLCNGLGSTMADDIAQIGIMMGIDPADSGPPATTTPPPAMSDDTPTPPKLLEPIALALIAVVGIGMITYLLFIRPVQGVAIGEMPFTAFAYQRDSSSNLVITNTVESGLGYTLNYELPDEDDASAGLAFVFDKQQDLADYQSIQVTIDFGDKNADCDLVITDVSGNLGPGTWIRLHDLKPQSVDEQGHAIYRITLPDNFDEVNLTKVTQVSFNAYTSSTRGNHSFTVYDVRFLR